MNRSEYRQVLEEVMRELEEPKGAFSETFGPYQEEEQKKIRLIAGVALCAADRFYSRLTRVQAEADGRLGN